MPDEWIVVNGHVLGQCAYLRSLDKPWELPDPCDCRDPLEDDLIWGQPEPDWDEGMHVAMDNTLAPDISTFSPRLLTRAEVPDAAL
ncbi:MAG TPA: hypothetical protein VF174_09020 [Micromonosporaceae bacterium]